MNQYDIELPKMDRPILRKTLKDKTNICTARLPLAKKFALVIDEGVDTVLFFHFETRNELKEVLSIDAETSEEYLDKLFEIKPNLKAWIPCIPFGEPGDVILLRTMDNKTYLSNMVKWSTNKDYSRSIFLPEENISINEDNIRFIHVLTTEETKITLDELRLMNHPNSKKMEFMIYMAQMHIKNYLKRRLDKELQEQNKK